MKIPKVNKFKGDNKQSFITWIAEFEAHARALGINQNKWRDNYFVVPNQEHLHSLLQK